MKKEYVIYGVIFAVIMLVTVIFVRKTDRSAVVHQETAVVNAPQNLDSEMFLGEVITLDEPWPSKIGTINFSVNFPPKYKFLSEAKPYLKLRSSKGLIKEWILESPDQALELGQDIPADQVSAELGLFYCREGAEALCLSQKVLFQIPVTQDAQSQDVSLGYQVSEDIF